MGHRHDGVCICTCCLLFLKCGEVGSDEAWNVSRWALEGFESRGELIEIVGLAVWVHVVSFRVSNVKLAFLFTSAANTTQTDQLEAQEQAVGLQEGLWHTEAGVSVSTLLVEGSCGHLCSVTAVPASDTPCLFLFRCILEC